MNDKGEPDTLLANLRADTQRKRRGKLKIFFGYCAGVGKTYAMLESAHRALAIGKDLVLGYVEPHARPATQRLTEGIESVPVREFDYRGVRVKEFDVDAALKRNPEILVIDELAHSNAEGARHTKRWQDVQELLDEGIDVWTTLNVQHIESLNDIVFQVTGVLVRETVPDQIFELADELELVDLAPEDLLDRLTSGQIYQVEQIQRAVQGFFQRSNLIALRELSLRQTANRVQVEVESARSLRGATAPWATADSLLVCVGPSPTTARVIRTAKRMATALNAKWIAASVDLPRVAPAQRSEARILQHFRLAEQLGAETVTLVGESIPDAIVEFARNRNVTKIFVGKTTDARWKRWYSRSVVERLIDNSGSIDVYVIQGDGDVEPNPLVMKPHSLVWKGYTTGILISVAAAMLAYVLGYIRLADAEANRIMIFLAGVAFTAFRCGTGPAVAASILSVLLFDFFFVPPYFNFTVSDAQYVVTFGVMLAIGLLISALAARLKKQISNSSRREFRAYSLYKLGKELSSLNGEMFLVASASKSIGELLDSEVAIYLRTAGSPPYLASGEHTEIALQVTSFAAANWVIEHEQSAGLGTHTLPAACALFVPLKGSQSCVGCLAIRPLGSGSRFSEPETRALLDACANQLALAIERDQMAIEAAEARIQAESEKLRNTLLSSVSHDLKTPLAAIAGASSLLLESKSVDQSTVKELLASIGSETQRLNRLLENILQMSKLESGMVSPNLQWHVLEEIVGAALNHSSHFLLDRPVRIDLPSDLPLVQLDDVMLDQVLVNLLENAVKYSPVGSPIAISASVDRSFLRLSIRDRGPGVPTGMEERIFEKFHRAQTTNDAGKGNGLGLAICRAIVILLKGTITASNPEGGGAEFIVRIPITVSPKIDVGPT